MVSTQIQQQPNNNLNLFKNRKSLKKKENNRYPEHRASREMNDGNEEEKVQDDNESEAYESYKSDRSHNFTDEDSNNESTKFRQYLFDQLGIEKPLRIKSNRQEFQNRPSD